MELGQKLKQVREGNNTTIKDLASSIGVSSSHISQIENNKSSPSISILKRIANELNTPITYFFSEDDESSTIKKGDRKKLYLPKSNLTYELLSPPEASEFQLLLTRIEVNSKMGEEPSIHPGKECCYIMSGVCKFIVKEVVHILEEGDSIYIPENAPHNAINVGEKEVTIISVISPSAF